MALLAVASLAACRTGADEQTAVEQAAEPELKCGANGYVAGEIYGAIRTTLDWDSDEVECTGMPRPEGSGARLRFSGPAGEGDRQLAIIIAMPEFSRDATGTEFSANVTLIEEGNGRFFSTPDLDNCLSEIATVEARAESSDQDRVTGGLYCVAPLPEVNGESSVSIPELQFSGLLDWSSS